MKREHTILCITVAILGLLAGMVRAAAPAAPEILRATADSTTSAKLTWDDRSSNERGFAIYRKTEPQGTWAQVKTVGANVESWRDTSLKPGTPYRYRMRAWNAESQVSAWSNEDGATTPRVAEPPPPTTQQDQPTSAPTTVPTDPPPATQPAPPAYLPHRLVNPTQLPQTFRTVRTASIATARAELAIPGTLVILAAGDYSLGSKLAMAADSALVGADPMNPPRLTWTSSSSPVIFQNDDKSRCLIEGITIATKCSIDRGIEAQGKHVTIRRVFFAGQQAGRPVFKNQIMLRPSARCITITDCDQPDAAHYWLYADGVPAGAVGSTLTVKNCKAGYASGPLEGHTVRGYWSDVVFENCEFWNVKGRTALTWKIGNDVSIVRCLLFGPTGFGPLADDSTHRRTTVFLHRLRVLGCTLDRNTSFERGVSECLIAGNRGKLKDVKVIRLDTRSGTESAYMARGIPTGIVQDNDFAGPDGLRMFSGTTQDKGGLVLLNNVLNGAEVR